MQFLKKCVFYSHLGIIAVACMWFFGFIYFAISISRAPFNETDIVDGIVVLTGGQGRIAEGIQLYQKGLGKKLFISGVHKGVSVQSLCKKQSVPLELTYLLKDAHLGYDAKNTIGNAKEVASWIKNNNIQSLRLVTADYHLQRSIFELLYFAPNIQVIGHPVKTIHGINRNTITILWREYLKFSIRIYTKLIS